MINCKGCGVPTDRPAYCSRDCFLKNYVKPSRPVPEKDVLQELIQTHSLASMGSIYGVSSGTIAKWLRIRQVYYSSFMPPKRKLRSLLKKMTIMDIAKHYKIPVATATRWTKQLYDNEQYISLAYLAKQLNYSRVLPSLWHRAGLIPNTIRVGRRVLVPKEMAETFKQAKEAGKFLRVKYKHIPLCVPDIGQLDSELKVA